MTDYKKTGKSTGSTSSRNPRYENSDTKRERRPRRKISDNDSGGYKKPFRTEDADRKPYRKRENESEKRYSDRKPGTGKPFRKRENEGEKTYSDKRTGTGKPFRRRENDGEKRYSDRKPGTGKPFRKRENEGEKTYSDKRTGTGKPFRRRENDGEKRYSDRKPGTGKPFRKRESEGEKTYSDKRTGTGKPFRKREDEGEKRYSDRKPGTGKPFRKRESEGEKTYSDKRTGTGKPFRKREDEGEKRYSDRKPGTGKPFRKRESEGEKTYSDKRTGTGKPYRKRENEGEKRYAERKPGTGKPFRKRENEGENSYHDKRSGKPRSNRNSSRSDKKEVHSSDIRLNRYIASTGTCSRRQADEFIRLGLVSLNGVTVTEMGIKVKPDDVVKLNGETITPERKVYILMNKPKDFITTTDDPQERRKVTDLLDREWQGRVYPVGRLDRNTTGVLLLTNDGDLTRKLLHPSQNKKKVYHVFLDKNLKAVHLHQLLEGIELEDGPIHADAVQYVDEKDKSQIGVELHSGKNHIIKRMFEYLGYQVIKLDRVYFAGLTKKGVERGHWRFLTEKEINMLKIGAFD